MPDYTHCGSYTDFKSSGQRSSLWDNCYRYFNDISLVYGNDDGYRGRRSGKRVKEKEFNRENNIKTVVTHRSSCKFTYADFRTANENNIIIIPLNDPSPTRNNSSNTMDSYYQTDVFCKHPLLLRKDAVIQHPETIRNRITDSTMFNETKRFSNWRSMTLNIQSCSDKFEDRLDSVLELASKRKISLLALTEFRRKGKDSRTIKTQDGIIWDIYWSGFTRKRLHGVAIAIRRDPKVKIIQVSQISPRMMWIDIQHAGLNIRVYSLYAPTNCPLKPGNDAERAEFWRSLQKEVDQTPGKTEQLFLGDLNATTNLVKHLQPTHFGRNNHYITDFSFNENGEAMTSFCAKNGLGMLNSYFTHKQSHLITHHSNNGHTYKTLDYALASQTLASYCLDCRVKNNYMTDTILTSDHRCLIQRWATPLRKEDRRKSKAKSPTPEIDYSSLQDVTLRCRYIADLTKVKDLNELHPDVNSQSTIITEELNNIAHKLLPKKPLARQTFPWRNDSELKQLKAQRSKLNYSVNKTQYRFLSKLIKSRADILKKIFYQEKADEVNSAAVSRDLEKLFRNAKNHGAFNDRAPSPAACNKLREHFKVHFNKEPPTEIPHELIEPPNYLIASLEHIISDNIDGDPPGEAEVRSAIAQLKLRKSTTDTQAELLQAITSDPDCLRALSTLYTDIWQQKELPDNWKYARLKALFKNKGVAKDAVNYRGLSISSTQLKVLCIIILRRLGTWYESNLLEGQFGFRSNRGCQDAIYCLKRVQQIFHEKKEDLYIGFIDLKAAFDWVPREWMFTSIKKRNVSNNEELQRILELLEIVYAETYNYMTDDDIGDAFRTTSGVRQGGCESPSCFNLYLDFILRVFEHECRRENLGISIRYRIPNEATDRVQRAQEKSSGVLTLTSLGYADDLGILAKSVDGLQRALEILYKLLRRFGLQMSLDKTKTMIMSDNFDEDSYPKTICVLEDEHIQNVVTFTYLGQQFTYNEPYTSSTALLTRKFSAINSYHKEEKFYKNHAVALNTRRKFFDSMFRSKLTYACQTWTTTVSSLNTVCSAYSSYLRNLVKGGQVRKMTPLDEAIPDDDENQQFDMAFKMKNETILKHSGATPLKKFIYKQQINWFAHIVRSSNLTYIKKLTFADEKSKRLGQPLNTLIRSIYKRFKNYEPSQILKACFTRTINKLVES